MTWLIGLFARMGVGERLRGPLGYLTAGLLLALLLRLLWAIWLHSHDAQVIEDHEAPIAAAVASASANADAVANANDAERRANEARADAQLLEVINDATAKHPAEVRRDAGPAVSRTLDELRRRQAPPARPAPGK